MYPYLPNTVWTKPMNMPNGKRQITPRVNAGMLDFLRRAGNRYQTRVNVVPRVYVEVHRARGP
jgi:uncharacterized protein (DUF4415 family)